MTTKELKITFDGEDGYDAGGLTREWTNLVFNEILNPDYGLFELSANKITLQPSSKAFLLPNYLTHLRYIGRLIAKCLLDGF